MRVRVCAETIGYTNLPNSLVLHIEINQIRWSSFEIKEMKKIFSIFLSSSSICAYYSGTEIKTCLSHFY